MLARLRDERGIGLITAVMASFVVTLLVTVSVAISVHSSTQSAYDRRRAQSVAAAEAGIDYYLSHLESVSPSAVECEMSGTLTATPITRYVVTTTFLDVAGQPVTCPFSGAIPAAVRVSSVGTSSAATPARTIEAYADLVAVDRSVFGQAAFFSETSPVLSANVNIYGDGLDNGDVYTNGDLVVPSNTRIHGSAYVQGALTLRSNSEISGEAWSGGAMLLSKRGSTVSRDATSSTSSITVDGGLVRGHAKAGTTITTLKKGRIGATRTPNEPSGPPPRKDLPDFTFDAAEWMSEGYAVQPFSGCDAANAFLNNLPSTNVVVRITDTCELEIKTTVTARANVAIISDGGIRFRSGSQVVTDGSTRTVALVAGLAEVPSCDLTMDSNTALGPGINTFMYSPCTVRLGSNGLVVRGQVLGGTVVIGSSTTLNYSSVDVPGIGSSDGLEQNLRYVREIQT